MTRKRTYTELSEIDSFMDRYIYLKLSGNVGEDTFGYDRYLNQVFYKDRKWKDARREVIMRDNGCDLGIEDRKIGGPIVVHHMNPITLNDILNRNPDLWNPEYLICVSELTHKAIHYGDESLLIHDPIERKQYDTVPWRY